MDKIAAVHLSEKLSGSSIQGYKVMELINHGKSAAVFKVQKNSEFFALKVFDCDLVERYGHQIQTQRIDQELMLRGHEISNLVKIINGGSVTIDDEKYFYIVMEFLNGSNLKDFIVAKNYDELFVVKVLQTLVDVSEKLIEAYNIVHRDIKPENIMVLEDGQIKLMDLGVLKLISAHSFSDEEEKAFVGTLRYAPPEFLSRQEVDSVECWRAVNLYQIGAVLHDLIVKNEIFHDRKPYPNLVFAIHYDLPPIFSQYISYKVIQLTRDLLTKDWERRLVLCPIARMMELSLEAREGLPLDDVLESIRRIELGYQSEIDVIDQVKRTVEEKEKKEKDFSLALVTEVHSCFDILHKKNIFGSYVKASDFYYGDEREANLVVNHYVFILKDDWKKGFPRELMVLVTIINDDKSYCEIKVLAIFPGDDTYVSENDAEGTLMKVQKDMTLFTKSEYKLSPFPIFIGSVEFDDTWKQNLIVNFARLIECSLKAATTRLSNILQYEKAKASKKVSKHPGKVWPTVIDKLC